MPGDRFVAPDGKGDETFQLVAGATGTAAVKLATVVLHDVPFQYSGVLLQIRRNRKAIKDDTPVAPVPGDAVPEIALKLVSRLLVPVLFTGEVI